MPTRHPAHLSAAPAPRRHGRKLLVVPFAVGIALAAGMAFAAWTSDATGTGQARSTVALDSTIAPGTSSADLYPGATKTVTVTVNNPNDYPVMVTSISAGSSPLVNTGCTAGTVTSDARALDVAGLTQQDGTTKVISAGGSGSYVLTTRMAGSAADACQGQTFTMALTGTLVSAA